MTKPRTIRTPLYVFNAADGVTYTAEGERKSDSNEFLVTLHLGYPRERVVGTTTAMRTPDERVQETIVNAAALLLPKDER